MTDQEGGQNSIWGSQNFGWGLNFNILGLFYGHKSAFNSLKKWGRPKIDEHFGVG